LAAIELSPCADLWRDSSERFALLRPRCFTLLRDARRTAGSNIAALTGSAEAADRVLNHAMPGITSRYVLHDFGDVKQTALQLWADKLACMT